MSRNLALVLLGDCMLGRIVDESLTALPRQLSGVWGDTLPLLQGGLADAAAGEEQLVAANLECAVTAEEGKDEERAFNFKLHPSNLPALKAARIDFVSLANNHCLDYKQAGLAETQLVLASAGIAFAGVGRAAEAARPAILEQGGLRLAFFSYADHFPVWAATDQRSGINYIDPEDYSPAALHQQLVAAKEAGADLTVVFIHWGPNWRWRPFKAIQRLARDFVDAGADIVFGHSAHHIQGIQVYRGAPIIYSAGAFVDDYRLDEGYRNDLSFLFCCHIAEGRPAWLELVPTHIVHTWQPGERPPYLSQVHLARGSNAAWLHSRIRELCKPFGTEVEDAGGSRLRIPLQGTAGMAAGEGSKTAAGGGSAAAGGGLLSKMLGMLRV
ncbi:poly-gamma-glutamate biosynthesis isoform A [Chlorella sorokiniana]|uniref:Poly-gamma-glutamate biosynthesis isoform A n=1 Tax=Chlorella sorokiniana TaxID=3076 RepID=A0A2P6TDX1_CHLSO|nr:poly-gamma-glutamate biosynthesis isoform A [Chlorella sorokiniana]|eukprot:PRW20840.1 poly-gamma-glutamate biosynthesis isoform A [Chlorella sorokiniana]